MTAQSVEVNIFSAGLWPQQDARDPLGVWAGRRILTATVGGGPLKVAFQPGEDRAGAHIYTCYFATIAQLSGVENVFAKCRLETNWPDADIAIGIQGASTVVIAATIGSPTFTAPLAAPNRPLVNPQERFVLLFDPRPAAGGFTIVELEQSDSLDTRLYAFEAWGYYWDRQVMQTPGGPRHPGAN